MPQKTPKELEDRLIRALARKSFSALGFWTFIVELLDTYCDGRPGELMKARSPLPASRIADLVGERVSRAQAARVPRLLLKLTSVSVKMGRVEFPILEQREKDGCYWSPAVAEIGRRRQQHAKRQATSHRRKKRESDDPLRESSDPLRESAGSQNPPNGFSPLIPLSSLSPPERKKAAGGNGTGTPGTDALDDEIRRYCGQHRMLDWHPKTHAAVRKLVESEGWDRAKTLIEMGVSKGKSFPAAYALGVAQREAQAKEARNGNGHEPQRHRSAVAVAGREDD